MKIDCPDEIHLFMKRAHENKTLVVCLIPMWDWHISICQMFADKSDIMRCSHYESHIAGKSMYTKYGLHSAVYAAITKTRIHKHIAHKRLLYCFIILFVSLYCCCCWHYTLRHKCCISIFHLLSLLSYTVNTISARAYSCIEQKDCVSLEKFTHALIIFLRYIEGGSHNRNRSWKPCVCSIKCYYFIACLFHNGGKHYNFCS